MEPTPLLLSPDPFPSPLVTMNVEPHVGAPLLKLLLTLPAPPAHTSQPDELTLVMEAASSAASAFRAASSTLPLVLRAARVAEEAAGLAAAVSGAVKDAGSAIQAASLAGEAAATATRLADQAAAQVKVSDLARTAAKYTADAFGELDKMTKVYNGKWQEVVERAEQDAGAAAAETQGVASEAEGVASSAASHCCTSAKNVVAKGMKEAIEAAVKAKEPDDAAKGLVPAAAAAVVARTLLQASGANRSAQDSAQKLLFDSCKALVTCACAKVSQCVEKSNELTKDKSSIFVAYLLASAQATKAARIACEVATFCAPLASPELSTKSTNEVAKKSLEGCKQLPAVVKMLSEACSDAQSGAKAAFAAKAVEAAVEALVKEAKELYRDAEKDMEALQKELMELVLKTVTTATGKGAKLDAAPDVDLGDGGCGVGSRGAGRHQAGIWA